MGESDSDLFQVQLVLDALLRGGYKELANECECLVKIHKGNCKRPADCLISEKSFHIY